MHRQGADCVLIVSGGKLAGIFTDRDAVLKAAGIGPRARSAWAT